MDCRALSERNRRILYSLAVIPGQNLTKQELNMCHEFKCEKCRLVRKAIKKETENGIFHYIVFGAGNFKKILLECRHWVSMSSLYSYSAQ